MPVLPESLDLVLTISCSSRPLTSWADDLHRHLHQQASAGTNQLIGYSAQGIRIPKDRVFSKSHYGEWRLLLIEHFVEHLCKFGYHGPFTAGIAAPPPSSRQ